MNMECFCLIIQWKRQIKEGVTVSRSAH